MQLQKGGIVRMLFNFQCHILCAPRAAPSREAGGGAGPGVAPSREAGAGAAGPRGGSGAAMSRFIVGYF
jgi:hypothetical protein